MAKTQYDTSKLNQIAKRGVDNATPCHGCGKKTLSHVLVSWRDHVEVLDDANDAIGRAQDAAECDEIKINMIICCHTCFTKTDLPLDGEAAREFIEECGDDGVR